MNQHTLARAHGAFNILSGAWPLLHLRSFEAVTGPKTDDWLVHAVANLLVATGITEASTADDPAALAQTRKAGIGVAAALTAIDLVYVPRRRISKVYLLDAAGHLFWIVLWLRSGRRR